MQKLLSVMWSSAAPAAINANPNLSLIQLDCDNEGTKIKSKVESVLIKQGVGSAVNEVTIVTVGTYAVTKITNMCDNSFVYVKEYINDITPFLTCCENGCLPPISETNDVVVTSNIYITPIVTQGNPVAYQWQKDGVNMPGKTSATLTIANASAADNGTYHAVISNACGTIDGADYVVDL